MVINNRTQIDQINAQYGKIMELHTEEQWIKIIGFQNYIVSNYGNIKSIDRFVNSGIKNNKSVFRKGKLLHLTINKYGYLQVTIYKDGKPYNKTVHQLVAIAFVDNQNNYPDINHLDTVKTNNYYLNLEWCNSIINNAHAVKHRLFPHGQNSHKTTLTIDHVRSIRKEYCKNMSSLKLAVKYNVSKPTILNILKFKTWKYDE